MQFKKAFLFLAVACATLTPQAYAASHTPQASISINQERDTKTDYRLINDSTGIYDSTSRQSEEDNLKKILSSIDNNSSPLRIYTFIYDSANKDIPSVEEELIAKAELDNNVAPIIFIYNTADKSYKYIIDNRVSAYASEAYLQTLTDSLVKEKDNPKATDFNELLDRISTMIVASSNADIHADDKISGVSVDESKFETRDFSEPASAKKKDTDSSLPKDSKNHDSSDLTLPICGVLILAIVGFAVYYKKKAQNRKTMYGGRR